MTTQELWQTQDVGAPRLTPAYLRGRANDALRAARRRNLYEYFTAPVAIVCGAVFWFITPQPIIRASYVWMILASLIYVWRWRRVAKPTALPAELGAMDTLRFHRRELERQYSAHRGNRLWNWLFLPSLVLAVYGVFLQTGGSVQKLLQMGLVLAVGLGLTTWITESKVAKLRREIELLDLMAK